MSRWSRWVAPLMAGLVVAAATAGCAGGRATLGTSTGACFLALPGAEAAVHGVGKLVGVKEFNAHDLVVKLSRRARQTIPGSGTSAGNPSPATGYPSGVPATTAVGGAVGGGIAAPGAATPGTAVPKQLYRQGRAAKSIAEHLAVFGKKKVCAVEYQGTYPAGSVGYALDPEIAGRYVIVVLPAKGGQPIVSFVVRKLPFSLRHFF